MKKIKNGSFFRNLGPGISTGASDDDPSGILTYLQAGAVMKYGALWVALITLPLMYAVQEMCGRIGFVTGKGLSAIIKKRYPKVVLFIIASLCIIAITINIGADLLAVGVSLEGLSGISRMLWIPIVSVVIVFSTVFLSYRRFSQVLKWLAFSLLFYVASVFFMKVDWSAALIATILPTFDFSAKAIMLLTAVLGTTISPYLFFWQTNEEAEERESIASDHPLRKFIVTKKELGGIRADTFVGMAFSNIVMWFIILGASRLSQLYGVGEITSFDQAASVLRPILGNFAYLIFTLGIIGTGLLAIPVLAGSVGYVVAEVFKWKEGINRKLSEARGFYIAIAAATFGGVVIASVGIDPIALLIYTAVFYAIITPPLIFMIIRMGNDRKLMGNRTNSPLSNILGVAALALTTAAVAAYALSWFGII